MVADLDRVNVGFAALEMDCDLGLSAAVYGLGSGIFFVSYTLLEIPSNLMLARVGAGVWMARILRFFLALRRPDSPPASASTSRSGFPLGSGPARSRSS